MRRLKTFPVEKIDPRLADAIARGISARRKLMADEGGSISAEAAAEELGVSKKEVLKRHQQGQMLAWREENQTAYRFPIWQFRDHKVLDGMEETLKILNSDKRLDDIARMFFFLATRGSLGGKRALDCLRAGEIASVFCAAHAYVE